jgi:hypothetical protein
MNANELAKGLSQNQIYGDDHGLFNKRIQNMLRQQQAEIEHLKQLFGCDPAYYEKSAKTLTDEEILRISKLYNLPLDYEVIGFVEAILRKAQEK